MLLGKDDDLFYTQKEIKQKFDLPMSQALALLRQALEETQVIVLKAEFLKITAEDLLELDTVKVTDVQVRLQECIEEARGVETSALEAGVRVSRAIKMMRQLIQQCKE